MIPLNTQLKVLRPPNVQKRIFNDWVREGLKKALEWFLRERWHTRFGQQASNRHKYSRRSTRHLIKKAIRFGIPFTRLGNQVKLSGQIANVDPMPFEFTGDLRRTAERGATIRATATTQRQRGRLKLPFGHAIHPSKVGELNRFLVSEIEQMKRIVIEHVQFKISVGS